MSIESVLFDLDGTLVDTSPGIGYALREAIVAVIPGRETDLPDLRSLIGPPLRDMLVKALGDIDSKTLDELERWFRYSYDSVGWQKCAVYDGVVETMSRLAQLKVKCFVITNKRMVPTARILGQLQLSGYFNEVVSLDSGMPPFGSKVDVVYYIIRKHHLDSEAMLLVGDSGNDAQAAQTCGVKFAAVAYGYGDVHAQQMWRKDYILYKVPDLLEIVLSSL